MEAKQTKVLYRHYYSRSYGHKSKGGITVAFMLVDKQMHVGMAFCSANEQFCRKEGRKQALSILNESPLIVDIIYLGDKPKIALTIKNMVIKLLYEVDSDVLFNARNHPYWFAPFPTNTYESWNWDI